MGQAEVLEILQKEGRPLPADEIAEICKASYAVVIRALNTMLKYREIKRGIIVERRHSMRKVYVWSVEK